MYVYLLGIEIIDVDLDQEVLDAEDQKVMIDVVVLEVTIGDGREGVKNEKDIEEMADEIMIVETVIVHVVVLREGIGGQIEEIVQLGGILNKEKVLLKKK